eukprot:g6522.t1
MWPVHNLLAFSVTSGFVGFYGGKLAADRLRHLLPTEDDDDDFQDKTLVETKERKLAGNQLTAAFCRMESGVQAPQDATISLESVKKFLARWKE